MHTDFEGVISIKRENCECEFFRYLYAVRAAEDVMYKTRTDMYL